MSDVDIVIDQTDVSVSVEETSVEVSIQAPTNISIEVVETPVVVEVEQTTVRVEVVDGPSRIPELYDVADDAAPTVDYILMGDGTQWRSVPQGTSFAFSIASFADNQSNTQLIGPVANNWLAIGGFTATATYENGPPTSAYITVANATGWTGNRLDVATPYAAWASTQALKYPSGPNVTVTFTLHANDATDTESVLFTNTIAYGASSTDRGAYDQTALAALSTTGASESYIRSYTINAWSGQHVVIAHPTRLSNVAQITVGGVTAAFSATATTVAPDHAEHMTFANTAGYSESYTVLTSLLDNLGSFSSAVVASLSSTPTNWLYWGGSASASGISESDIESTYGATGSRTASNSVSSRSMTVTIANSAHHAYIAFPTRLGSCSSIVIDGLQSLNNFTMDTTALAMTNEAGFQENYTVMISDNPGFDNPTTMTVTVA